MMVHAAVVQISLLEASIECAVVKDAEMWYARVAIERGTSSSRDNLDGHNKPSPRRRAYCG